MKRTCLFFILNATLLAAQSSGTLVGLITIGAGDAVQNARITLVDMQSHARRETTTNELGIYAFSLLPAGEYRLEAVKKGLAPLRLEKIFLDVGEKRSLRLQWDPCPVQPHMRGPQSRAAACPAEVSDDFAGG